MLNFQNKHARLCREGSIYDVRVRTEGGGGSALKQMIVLIGCVSVRAVESPDNFADIINGSPL